MAIPDYQTLMLPILKVLGDKQEHRIGELKDQLAREFNLSESDRVELLPSGRQAIFDNRVGWARTYLKKAGLIEYRKRGVFSITDRGIQVLAETPGRIDIKFLDRFPEFREFRQTKRQASDAPTGDSEEGDTPEETLESAYQSLKSELSDELLEAVKRNTSTFFENLVADLLLKMGYGGSRKEAGEAVGRSGDGGIDGIIKEDRLGLDIIYIQAKRWDNAVGRPEVQKFAGALQGQRAKKGILITTSSFSPAAIEYAQQIDSKIILVDGARLSELMIEHDVGVARVVSYHVKRLDSDYFGEE